MLCAVYSIRRPSTFLYFDPNLDQTGSSMEDAIVSSLEGFDNIDIGKLSALGEPATRGGKELLEGVVNLMEEFKERFVAMFSEMKTGFMDIFDTQNSKISALEKTVVELRDENIRLKKAVTSLDDRIDENEAYERKANLILNGEEVPEMEADEELPEKTRDIALALFKSKLKLSGIGPEDISIAHRLGPNPKAHSTLKRDIMVKFSRRDAKNTVLFAARKMKVPNFYINEQLTARRKLIAKALRKAKKDYSDIIASTTSQQGSIYVWVKPPRADKPGARNTRLCINTEEKLAIFCEKTLGISVDVIMTQKK